MRASRLGWWRAAMVVLAGCSGGPLPLDGSFDGGERSDGQVAEDGDVARCGPGDEACDDGLFCNGRERCEPSIGCVSGEEPCMPTQTCDEERDRCLTLCDITPDADGDGRSSTDCAGDDCDDADPRRFPGNTEICDTDDVDEDCDPTTFGFRDLDGDDEPDAACCNVSDAGERACGTDCDDVRAGVNPNVPEVCDGRDNNCDGNVDEERLLTFWPDSDGDTFGDPAGAPVMGCTAPPGYAVNDRDCDDTATGVNPSVSERCDAAGVDENCDGVTPPCPCFIGETRPCTLPGICAIGTEACVDGEWASSCSIAPVTETCNGLDDDCDGAEDEGLKVVCYVDADNDGYAAPGARRADACPDPSRPGLLGCPNFTTHRAPMDPSLDCADGDPTRRPGASELCNAIDDDCDGIVDETLRVACFADVDNDTYAPASSTMTMECPVSERVAVGGCPLGTTNRAPGSGSTDCDDMASARRPGATEVCTSGASVDDDCDGMVDEGVSVSCFADDDGDGYAAAGASASMQCRADSRPTFGFCPIGFAALAPTGPGSTDCRPMNAAVSPAANELCDAMMIDENCDGVANPTTLCMCSGTETRTCLEAGVCGTGTQQCASGAWGPCTVGPVAEVCDGRDEDCDGTIDDDLRVTCYADEDDDDYAPAGASASTHCPVGGRAHVGGCPVGTTNLAPGVGTTDCNDALASVRPGGAEVCTDAGPAVDEDCDGLTDEALRVSCYADGDNDTYAPTSSGATSRCRDASRPAAGFCPALYTDRAPALAADCDDSASNIRPGAAESCDRLDFDCSSGGGEALDEDVDGDGHAPLGASCSGGFPADDCNDLRADTYPGAAEVCDRHDANCTGDAAAEDADGDGHASPTAPCTGGFPTDDCDDTRSNRFPGQTAFIAEPICAPGVPVVSCSGTLTCGTCGPIFCPGGCPPPNLHDYDCSGSSTPQASSTACPGPFASCTNVPVYSGLTGYLCGRPADLRICQPPPGFPGGCGQTGYVEGGTHIGCR